MSLLLDAKQCGWEKLPKVVEVIGLKTTKHQHEATSIKLPTVWLWIEYQRTNFLPSYSYRWRNKALWAEVVHPHYPTSEPQNACLVDPLGNVAHIIDPNWLSVALQIDCRCSPLMHQEILKTYLLDRVSMPRQLKKGLALLLYIEIRKYYLILTCPRRLRSWSGWLNPLFLFPLRISSTKTPKL